jgi:nucleoside-diphosphate-sugar epimerase
MLYRLCLLAITSLLLSANYALADDDVSVLLFGGTGRLGSDIAKALVRNNKNVTVFVRETSDRSRLHELPVEFVVGDVLDAASVKSAFEHAQYDVVVDALGRGKADSSFFPKSAQVIASAAAANDVQQLFLNGSVGAGDSANHPDYQSLPASFQNLMRAKTEAESIVVNSGVNFTIIRNSHLVAYGVSESGNAELYEDHSIVGSVTRQGLARLITGCVLNEACFNKIYHAVDKTYPKKD